MTTVRLFSVRRPRHRLVPLLWLALVMAAWGLPGVRAADMAAFEIVASGGHLTPETLTVPAGVKLRLTLRNKGKVPVEFENLALRIEKVVAPDGAATITVQPLKAGSYPVVDDFRADTAKMRLIAR